MFRYLDQEFEVEGEWFFPEDPEKKCSGTLRCSKGRCRLDLFQPEPLFGKHALINTELTNPIIHGVTESGEAVTVLDSICTRNRFALGHGGRAHKISLSSDRVFFGGQIESRQMFHRIIFYVPQIELWLSQKGGIIGDQRRNENTFVIDIEKIDDLKIPIDGGHIKFFVSFAQSSKDNKFNLSTFGGFEVVSERNNKIDFFINVYNKVIILISFLAGCKFAANHISVDYGRTQGSLLLPLAISEICDIEHFSRFFISWPHIQECALSIFEQWFLLVDKAYLPLRLAHSSIHSDVEWTNVRFLLLMQAFEGLHRAVRGGKYVDDSEYNIIKDNIISKISETVPSDLRRAIVSRVKYGNEYSLRKRLNNFLNEIPDEIADFVYNKNNKILNKWVKMRNYYTHLSVTNKQKLEDDNKIFYHNLIISEILRVLYLLESGVSSDLILDRYKNESCDRSRYLALSKSHVL